MRAVGTVAFLELNGHDLVVTDVAATDRSLQAVAAGEVELDALAEWIGDHIRPLTWR
ncbi:hypothetical protein [Agromyces sp. ZXT2-6]|uniref:hypothetical protein n=1 Tax=Agromyces sp. ZXT2-6 TaxID=3461153 RepID=UPI004054C3EC